MEGSISDLVEPIVCEAAEPTDAEKLAGVQALLSELILRMAEGSPVDADLNAAAVYLHKATVRLRKFMGATKP